MCVCACRRPKLQDKHKTWRQIQKAPTNNLRRLPYLTNSLHPTSSLLVGYDGVDVFGGLPRTVQTGTVLLLHNLGLQEIAPECEAFDPDTLTRFLLKWAAAVAVKS